MRVINLNDRAAVQTGNDTAVDVHEASSGRFGPSMSDVYEQWADFIEWGNRTPLVGGASFSPEELGPPSPRPRQIFAIGLNYHAHAKESGQDSPTDLPPVFPKFLSSLTGPVTEVRIPYPEAHVDWEAELVVVIGKQAHTVPAAEAWDVVAGLTVGNDISERIVQLRGPAPQFGLGKSYPGFTPTGPALVTPDEVPDKNDLAISTVIDGESRQQDRTSQMIFSVSTLIEGLTKVVTLYPGDLIFTGTPSGVGAGRCPHCWIAAGQTMTTSIESIGQLSQTFTAEE